MDENLLEIELNILRDGNIELFVIGVQNNPGHLETVTEMQILREMLGDASRIMMRDYSELLESTELSIKLGQYINPFREFQIVILWWNVLKIVENSSIWI